MSGFAPGDVVVCVDGSPPKNALRQRGHDLVRAVCRIGSVYRVSEIRLSTHVRGRGVLCLRFAGVDCEPYAGFVAVRFRKIRPADESFTRQVRACRPIKTKVEA